jgi:hypothetical protein
MPCQKYIVSIRPIIRPISASIAYVVLTRGTFALIDVEDADRVGEHNWQAHIDPRSDTVWAQRTARIFEETSAQTITLHRFLLETSSSRVDHRDRNGLNNCKWNLRPATSSENARNSKMRVQNKSGFKGVHHHLGKVWLAQITYQGKNCYLGTYKTPEEAHAAYCAAAVRLHGEFARF